MKIQDEIQTLIKEGEYRKKLVVAIAYQIVKVFGEIVFPKEIYAVFDEDNDFWYLKKLFIKDGEVYVDVSGYDYRHDMIDARFEASILNTEGFLVALHGILEELGAEEIETRISEKADQEATLTLIQKFNLSSEDDLLCGESLKYEYQDEYCLLYSELVDKYNKEIPYPGSVVCVGCGSTNVSCDAVVQVNARRVIERAESAFYDGCCSKCGWAVLTDTERVCEDIDKMLSEFMANPTYAYCEIAYREKGSDNIHDTQNVWVKLSPRTSHDPDDKIFFYFQNIGEFQSYAAPVEGSEFVIIGINKFSDTH